MSQERRLMRRLNGVGGNPCATGPFNQPVDPKTQLAIEQDWKRDRLAEELLKIALEESRIGDFTDCHRRETVHRGENDENSFTEDVVALTVEQWFVKLADAAMKAAEVVYPEIPEAES